MVSYEDDSLNEEELHGMQDELRLAVSAVGPLEIEEDTHVRGEKKREARSPCHVKISRLVLF